LAHQLLGKIAESVTSYLNAQVAAGAQALMIFDTWGGSLSPKMYREFSLRYMTEIVSKLTRDNDGRKVPVILFTKGGGQWLSDMADSGCDGLGLDWTTDITLARQQVGDRVALQGNMDPSTLYASPEVIRSEAARILEAYGQGSGHVFNLGHGITPDINPEHVAELVNAVHELSVPYHAAD
ncbi:MAG: uroporphyrinogen decarboxylase, partial [Gammaproteobacteria bacterium]|nr:uroporphyrinogen decarboxylase [Gammaproteobacteria bacterium]